jgi:hypothetical protein
MKTLQLKNSVNRSPLRRLLLITLALGCFALSPMARAVTPDPDGGYPGQNTAEGEDALLNLTTGSSNTAIGFDALFSNTTGESNTAIGSEALYSNTVSVGLFGGDGNTAIGNSALYNNSTGGLNTAIGSFALAGNTTSYGNTATGVQALQSNTTGIRNIALGYGAGFNLTTGDDNIDIGNQGVAGESNTIRIGTQGTQTRTFIAGISGTTLGNGVAVRVNANGRLGTAPSSARFKDAIKPMDKASEAILALTPVTFHYKKELDPEGIPQFGLVAEDVEKVNPDLVVRDADGKLSTVRYEAVNAMLLNEFLKEHRTVQEQKATIAQLKSTVEKQEATNAQQQKQIEALTVGLQKVSAQLEISKLKPRIVASDR